MRTVRLLLAVGTMLIVADAMAVNTAAGVKDVLPDKKGKEVKTETVRGSLQSVDNNQIKIRTDGKDSVAVKLDSQTKITVDGKDAALTDLKAGQQVSCTVARRVKPNARPIRETPLTVSTGVRSRGPCNHLFSWKRS